MRRVLQSREALGCTEETDFRGNSVSDVLLCRAMQAEAVAETEERGEHIWTPQAGGNFHEGGAQPEPWMMSSVVSRCEKNISLEVGGNQLSKWLLDTEEEPVVRKRQSLELRKSLNPEGYGWRREKRSSQGAAERVRQWGTHGEERHVHLRRVILFAVVVEESSGKLQAWYLVIRTFAVPQCPVLSDPCSNSAWVEWRCWPCFRGEFIVREIKQCSANTGGLHIEFRPRSSWLPSSGWGKGKLKWVWDSLSSLEMYSGPCFCLRSLESFLLEH